MVRDGDLHVSLVSLASSISPDLGPEEFSLTVSVSHFIRFDFQSIPSNMEVFVAIWLLVMLPHPINPVLVQERGSERQLRLSQSVFMC